MRPTFHPTCKISMSDEMLDALALAFTQLLVFLLRHYLYNHFHNILKFFDVLPNFVFTTSETMRDYDFKHGVYELPHQLPNHVSLNL